jgi:hypothetical protein
VLDRDKRRIVYFEQEAAPKTFCIDLAFSGAYGGDHYIGIELYVRITGARLKQIHSGYAWIDGLANI